MRCGFKVVYPTLREAEGAYYRTPRRPNVGENGPLLPYHCAAHGGYHLGHFTKGQAWRAWGTETYTHVRQFWPGVTR